MAERSRRALVVGMSSTEICGVRDHATLLAQGLEAADVQCSMFWLTREETTLGSSRAQTATWVAQLSSELEREKPDFVLLHYSVFAFAFKGIPLFVYPLTRALRRAGVPVLTIVHEAAYPWTIGGLRGKSWALTQRIALTEVMRVSCGALVTADFRVRWLESRRWLARRPIALAPVFSNLPPPDEEARAKQADATIGLFGYSYEGAAVSLVLDAIGLLRERFAGATLLLLGAPGRSSPAAQMWEQAARERGLEQALSFTGRLAAQDLADALARCSVLLFVNSGGPSSRKGTLAGSLGSGAPVVALDGPRRWSEIRDGETLRLVGESPRELADVVAALLGDREQRDALGARGREFAERQMAVTRTVDALLGLLDQAGV
jgi:glycosyltransferase involved in cell wall biosynthesis